MTDIDVAFLPKYHNMDPARLYVMILTSPPSLPLSRPWAFNSISVPGYKDKLTTDITHLPNYNKLDLARSHASILPCLPPPSRLSL